MSKELIEQLAKSHAFSFWQVPKIGYTYSFTEAQLEAFAKAYAQGQSIANEQDKKDAERYRFLRSDDVEWIDGMPYAAYDKKMLMDMVTIPLTESELDSAIDQCMINAAPIESGVKG